MEDVKTLYPFGSFLMRDAIEEMAKTREIITQKDAEIARLRKVVEAARESLPVMRAHIAYPCAEVDDLANALAELDE